jgi:hypothetical protein
MEFKVGNEITFNGSMDKSKELIYSGIRSKDEINPYFPNDRHIPRIMITYPLSHYRVREINHPYYLCEKIWESGDPEIPTGGMVVYIHEDEAIAYNLVWDGVVVNKRKE